MSKETAGSSVTVMGGMIVDFLQSAIQPFHVLSSEAQLFNMSRI